MTSALEKFLIDGDQVDIERLTELVSPFLQGIDKVSGNLYFKPSSRNVSPRSQVIIFLLAKKVAHQLSPSWPESMSVSEIVKSLPHIPEGTIKPMLSQQLKSAGLVSQDDQSKYFIPNHVLHGLNLESNNTQQPTRVTVSANRENHSQANSSSTTNNTKLDLDRKFWEQHIEALSKNGSYLERSLLVLKVAKDAGYDQGISPVEIEWFLREKIRSPISAKNISYALGKSSSSVCDREKKGKSFFYRIMVEGERVVDKYIIIKKED